MTGEKFIMKKKSISFTKRCISALLAVPIASLGLVTAFAENGTPEQSDVKTRDTYIIGDANGDGIVDVNDATTIQKAIAEISLEYFDETAADVDGSGLTVNNVTNIQKYLAEYKDPYKIGAEAAVAKSRTGFSDVVAGAWYEDAVDWGADNGIAQGIGDGLFGVGQKLTQADMESMLRRAAGLSESEETSAKPVDRITAVTAIWQQFGNGETALFQELAGTLHADKAYKIKRCNACQGINLLEKFVALDMQLVTQHINGEVRIADILLNNTLGILQKLLIKR